MIMYRPEYPPDANPLLLDLMKKMFEKDPAKRMNILDIVAHDWVTCNGIHPLPLHKYPSICLDAREKNMAIQKVSLIAKIRLRIRQKAV